MPLRSAMVLSYRAKSSLKRVPINRARSSRLMPLRMFFTCRPGLSFLQGRAAVSSGAGSGAGAVSATGSGTGSAWTMGSGSGSGSGSGMGTSSGWASASASGTGSASGVGTGSTTPSMPMAMSVKSTSASSSAGRASRAEIFSSRALMRSLRAATSSRNSCSNSV